MVECPHVRKYRLTGACSIFQVTQWACHECGYDYDVMGCIKCYFVGCDTLSGKGHARKHQIENSEHSLFVDVQANQIFCFTCDGYVLNDNRTGDIAQLKQHLSLNRSFGCKRPTPSSIDRCGKKPKAHDASSRQCVVAVASATTRRQGRSEESGARSCGGELLLQSPYDDRLRSASCCVDSTGQPLNSSSVDDQHPQHTTMVSTTGEDIFTCSIWHRRVKLLLNMFSMWRNNLHDKMGINSEHFKNKQKTKDSKKSNDKDVRQPKARARKKSTVADRRRRQHSKKRSHGNDENTSPIKRARTDDLTDEDSVGVDSPVSAGLYSASSCRCGSDTSDVCSDQIPLPTHSPSPPSLSSKTKQGRHRKVDMKKRCIKGITGLINLGNTCYMNVVIQVLGHLDGFCDAICRMSLVSLPVQNKIMYSHSGRILNPGLHGGSANNVSAADALEGIICRELHAIFNIIWSGKCPLYSPIGLQQAIWATIPTFQGYYQHDAHEFLTVLLDFVHKEMTTEYDIVPTAVESCFEGTLEKQVHCDRCNAQDKSSRDEKFQELSLCFPKEVIALGEQELINESNHYSLSDMVNNFVAWEKYDCQSCHGIMCCQKRHLIKTPPKILRIHVNRFCWIASDSAALLEHAGRIAEKQPESCIQVDPASSGSCKINWHVSFQDTLILCPSHLTSGTVDQVTSESLRYRLSAVIVHTGQRFDRGHYEAYFWHTVEASWVKCSDKDTGKVDIVEVLQSQAYILFYNLCDNQRLKPSASKS